MQPSGPLPKLREAGKVPTKHMQSLQRAAVLIFIEGELSWAAPRAKRTGQLSFCSEWPPLGTAHGNAKVDAPHGSVRADIHEAPQPTPLLDLQAGADEGGWHELVPESIFCFD